MPYKVVLLVYIVYLHPSGTAISLHCLCIYAKQYHCCLKAFSHYSQMRIEAGLNDFTPEPD